MREGIIQVVSAVIVALVTYQGTNHSAEVDLNKVIDTYSYIIQQQAHSLENCK